MENYNIGQILKDGLYQRKMKQTELAKRLNVEKTAVNRWCNGKSIPDGNTLLKIAAILEISLDHYIGIDPKELKAQNQRLLDTCERLKKDIDLIEDIVKGQ